MPRAPRTSPAVEIDPARRREFSRRLRAWFRNHGRDLPWRRTRDPYRVLVSELMLQQTQVSRVVDYYERFLARFPTLDHVAEAPRRSRAEVVGGVGLLRSREEPARARSQRRSRRRNHSGRSGNAPNAAGHRRVHRRRRRVVRLRAARGACGHERRPGAPARLSPRGRSEVRTRTARDVGDSRTAAPAHGATHVGSQPGPDGARRPDLHGPR